MARELGRKVYLSLFALLGVFLGIGTVLLLQWTHAFGRLTSLNTNAMATAYGGAGDNQLPSNICIPVKQESDDIFFMSCGGIY